MANIGNLFRAVQPQPPVDINPLPQFGIVGDNAMANKGAGIVLRSLLEQLQSLPSGAPPGFRPQADKDILMFGPNTVVTPGQFNSQKLLQKLLGLQI